MNVHADTPAPRPAQPLDEDLYRPLAGGRPAGRALEDFEAVWLGADFPAAEDDRLGPGDRTPRSFFERRELVLEFLGETRDLRAYVRLAEAQAHLDGPLGLHAGLHLLDAAVRGMWEAIHPAPLDDRRQAAERAKAFGPLRETALVGVLDRFAAFDAGGFDREITLRQVYLAAGLHQKTGRRPPRPEESLDTVERLASLAANAGAGERVGAVALALGESARILRGLQVFLGQHPDFQRVKFDKVAADLDHYARAVAALAPQAAPAPAGGETATEDGAGEATAKAVVPRLDIPDRAAARTLTEALITFFAAEGRSSPVPLVLFKILDMGEASFTDWLEAVGGNGPEKAALKIEKVAAKRFDELGEPPKPPEPPAPTLDKAALEAASEGLDQAIALLREHELAALLEMEIEMIAAQATALRDALSTSTAAPAPAAPTAPVIENRAAAREALRRLAAFHRSAEPSSPAGLCLERLAELVEKDFMELLHEIAHDGKPSLRLARKQT